MRGKVALPTTLRDLVEKSGLRLMLGTFSIIYAAQEAYPMFSTCDSLNGQIIDVTQEAYREILAL